MMFWTWAGGCWGYGEPVADLARRETLGERAQDLELAGGEWLDRRLPGAAIPGLGDPLGDRDDRRAGEQDRALVGGAHGLDDLGDVAGPW